MTQAPPEPTPQPETIGYAAHLVFILCGLIIVAFGFWSTFSTIDIVSMATGEVVPSSQVKSVQHLEGGIIRKILINEGDEVKLDQPLVVLEPTANNADVGELQVRLTSLRAEIARLKGLTNAADTPSFDADLQKDHPEMVNQALKLFHAQRTSMKGQLKKQRQTIQQRRNEISEVKARIKNGKKNLELINEQIAISQKLLKRKLTNRYEHLDLLKEAARLTGGVIVDNAALQSARSALAEARTELQNMTNIFNEEHRIELDDASLTFRELSQRMQKLKDNLKRTVVRSPVNGVIKSLYVFTVGGVLKPGDVIADVVPSGDRLIIEAKLANQDIGYINVGQAATLKLTSADAMRFGHINGTVRTVSPDALVMEDGVPYYKVLIEPDSERFERGKYKYNLFPGIQVMVSIQTGQRTVFEYLTGPWQSSMEEAFGER
ncbi:MAG: HlyD family type I secretion periplasmic adaptor subunit [Rhodospirillaceae bacterium]|jgi:membrane fusion protein, adhesin transport system|nr:HlyD family type I secretion periplasmic adaptor subunit [Rhodospirillaceae bacterium]MBT5244794.1 HlyD family type I secretion periplasmic adaptor subunit [Rhodospirillaceae bacterium]MBT5562252.1 HlyD family type I secretion periplasmic adaptor subunit [Rhodospirillaceae bacterium]MBT6242161.1 HlyD family type I secretion periplasmic adaptor subunit [Rhodospirillaceae bacterium]MBT7136804.1 HlyD family type I secretion periplasmic adaptor subunit [Rhodospirillaceae bacterium]